MTDNLRNVPSEVRQAFFNFLEEIPAIKKDGDNPYFNSKYSTLIGTMAVVKPIAKKHGFVILQPTECSTEHGTVGVGLQFLYKTGEVISFPPLTMSSEGFNAQNLGSAITYMRRYNLTSSLALDNGDPDDDGNSIMDVKTKSKPKSTGSQAPTEFTPDTMMWIGNKYKGKMSVRDVYAKDRSYIQYLLNGDRPDKNLVRIVEELENK